MQIGREKYSPVQIRNPISREHLVRLLPKQKLQLVFTKPEFRSCSVNVSGDFLKLDDIEQVKNGWVASISQVRDIEGVINTSLYLGEINVMGSDELISLCVVSDVANAECLRVIQPTINQFRIEPHQVLDVLFYSLEWGDQWVCTTGAGQLNMEQIDQCSRTFGGFDAPINGQWPVEEHYFRFRLDASSIELIQSLPHGRYDGGNLSFFKTNGTLNRSNIQIVLNWRDKKTTVYKALLLPKNAQSGVKQHNKKPKCAMQSTIVLKNIEYDEMDAGCNVIFAKCR
jgi:hypothetical protein